MDSSVVRTQRNSSDVGTFPGQRHIRTFDSTPSHAPLDPPFLRSFESALHRSQRHSYFSQTLKVYNGGNARVGHPNTLSMAQTRAQTAGYPGLNAPLTGAYQQLSPARQHRAELEFPINLFSKFPPLPPVEVFDALQEAFTNDFLPSCPFIRSLNMPVSTILQAAHKPAYHIFAMAAMGSASVEDPVARQWAKNLFEAAVFTHCAVAETDNLTTRRLDWVGSFALMEAFGSIEADTMVWSRTNMWHGHAETAARRQGLNKLADNQIHTIVHGSPQEKLSGTMVERTKIMCFYFTTDLIRALNYGMPPCFQAIDLNVPLSSGVSLRQVYEELLIDTRPLQGDFDSDDSVLLLLSILSEICILHHTLGPLAQPPTNLALFEDSSNGTSHPGNRHRFAEDDTESSQTYHNPYLSTSAISEFGRVSEHLKIALLHWEQKFSTRTTDGLVHQTCEAPVHGLVALYYFAHLLLSAGPGLLPLPMAAGYSPSTGFSSQSGLTVAQELQISPETLDIAWKILEILERDERESSIVSGRPKLTPLWYPIVTFYAGLSVWASCQSQGTTSMGSEQAKKRRMIRLFENELRHMHWGSAGVMANILRDLRLR